MTPDHHISACQRKDDDDDDSLSTLFTSLANDGQPWMLTRTLKSENPKDINGVLTGTATFRIRSNQSCLEMVYREEGEMMQSFGPSGLRWTKMYIWRLLGLEKEREISVWFVKVDDDKKRIQGGEGDGPQEEADYLFHTFDINDDSGRHLVSPPTPPPPPLYSSILTTVLIARGSHLCVNDMYHTAYAFRMGPTGQVVSWTSRHIVKGPKKNQDISNVYVKEG